jgi:hypothetical protein
LGQKQSASGGTVQKLNSNQNNRAIERKMEKLPEPGINEKNCNLQPKPRTLFFP